MLSGNPLELSQAAVQYGPFLFAIIFIVLVPPYAHVIWRKSLDVYAKNAAASALLSESRYYFRCSWIFGVFLVICSILWWVYAQQVAINRTTQFIAYTGYVSGLAPEDQLLSVSPDDPQYLVPAQVDGNVQYRFVYLSQTPLDKFFDLYVRYTTSKASVGPEGRVTLLIPFKLKAGETHYKFFTDKDKGAMVVPVSWNGS
jgi:hypothetical protein